MHRQIVSLSTHCCDKETIYDSKQEMRKHVRLWVFVSSRKENKRQGKQTKKKVQMGKRVIYEFKFSNLLPQPETESKLKKCSSLQTETSVNIVAAQILIFH